MESGHINSTHSAAALIFLGYKKTYHRYPELTAGISALFKVIYLGRKPGCSILLRHEEITKFSRKSTLRAGISGAARRRQSFSPQEPGEPDNDRKHQMRRRANSSRRRANTQKVCSGGELRREIRFPRAKVGKKASLSAFPPPHSSPLQPPIPASLPLPPSPSHLLCSLHPSLAALLPKEELSHGFPEPAVMLKL